jgi:hypothetical protein
LFFGEHQITAQNNSDVFVAKLSKTGEWLWAKAGLGSGFNRSNAITNDNAGNSYIIGSFESSVTFGNTNLTSSGSRDIFIAKINSSGAWQWAIKAGGTGTEDGLGVKYNSANVFLGITGYYSANSSFGQTVLVSKGGRDIFVASLDTNGNWNWAVSAASTGAEESRGIAIDGSGNSVITGYYTSALSFGDKNLPAGTGRDVYVAKIDKSGNWLWAANASGAGSDEANAIGLDNSGNAYITGWFSSDLKFGNTTLYAESERNLFVARISSSGTWSWGKIGSGSSLVEGAGISVSTNGTTFLAGYLYKDATFLNTTLNSLGESDIILARISSSGSWIWANSNGGVTGVVTGDGVAVDSSGNVIYSGSFYGSVKFGDDTLRSNGGADMYIAKYSPETGWIWAKSFGGTENDIAKSLAVDGEDNIYVVGTFQGTVNFGGISRQSNGITDAFIIKLSKYGNIVWANSVGDYDSDQGVKVLYKNDYLIFAGNYSRRPYFGNVRLVTRGYDDIFLSKLDTDGNYLWTTTAGSSQFDYVNDVNIDIDDNILMTGGFESTGYFDNNTVSSNGGDDIFVAKADSEGQWLWARSAGTFDYQESGWGIDSDLDKNIYVVSVYRALCLYGSQYLVNNGLSDIALSKLDSSGNWIWSKEIGGTNADFAYSLKYRYGRLSIAGAVSNGFSLNGKQFISNGLRNAFISNFDTNGDILWVKSDESNGTSEIKKIAIDDENIAYMIGNYSQNIKFGNLMSSEINSVDKNAFFISNGSTLEKPDWTFSDSTGKSAVVKIPSSISPKVNGRNLTQGDAIGVFYTRNNQFYCAGMEYWKGSDLEITVWGDNPSTPIKDGFFDDEKYSIRVWDVLKAEEVGCTVRYESGPDKFADSAYSVILQLPIIYDTLAIPINQGWNMISSYCLPSVPSMDSILCEKSTDGGVCATNSLQIFRKSLFLIFIFYNFRLFTQPVNDVTLRK